jgi:hypothetical protein
MLKNFQAVDFANCARYQQGAALLESCKFHYNGEAKRETGTKGVETEKKQKKKRKIKKGGKRFCASRRV